MKTNPRRKLRERRWARERRENGFSEADAWSFDTYLAGVIAGGVKQLAENLHGCPPELTEDAKGNELRSVDEACEVWKGILEEIVVGFEWWEREKFVTSHASSPEFDRAMELLAKWWGHLWD